MLIQRGPLNGGPKKSHDQRSSTENLLADARSDDTSSSKRRRVGLSRVARGGPPMFFGLKSWQVFAKMERGGMELGGNTDFHIHFEQLRWTLEFHTPLFQSPHFHSGQVCRGMFSVLSLNRRRQFDKTELSAKDVTSGQTSQASSESRGCFKCVFREGQSSETDKLGQH